MPWYYATDKKQKKGPIKEAEFIKLFQNNTITRDTLVWNGKTVKKWCKISSIEGVEDEMKNWKPGCGRLLKSGQTPRVDNPKISEQQQLDEHDVEKRSNTQANAKAQQAQICQAVQTTDKAPEIDELQKEIREEDKSPMKVDEMSNSRALKEIIQTNADMVEEKYSECMENLESKVTDLEVRLSKKVEQVEVLKEKLQTEKVETKTRLEVLAQEKEEVDSVVKGKEASEPAAPSDHVMVKNLQEELRAKLRALENSSGHSSDDWDKWNQENASLQAKNLALTEEHRLFQEKMDSRVTDLESQLSRKVNETNEQKENLLPESEIKLEWAKLEKERNILKKEAKTLNEQRSKFEKFKHKELVRIRSCGQVAGNASHGAEEKSSGLFRWRWTLLSVGLVSVVGYKMLSRAIAPEQKTQSRIYSGGERGKGTFSDTIASKLSSKLSSVFNF